MDNQVCPIAQQARLQPHAIGICTDTEEYTYQALDELVSQLSEECAQCSIGPGSRVAFIAETSVITIAVLFALFRLHATACPLSFRWPSSQIDGLLERLSATHFLNPSSSVGSVSSVSSVGSVVKTLRQSLPIHTDNSHTWIATALFTSGSSGTPKIACHTLDNHLFNAFGAIPALNLTKTSRYLLSLPLFHVSGISILFRIFLTGSTVVITEQPLHLSLTAHQVTHASFVPTQLYRLLQDPTWHPTHLTCALIGGAALSPTLCTLALVRRIPIMATYGMTEMGSMIICGKAQEDRPLSGTLLPFRELKRDETGELHVRGHTLFKGYWNADTHSCNLPLNDGWFATGDLGEQLSDGSWILTGRKDRLFISGGENIQPEEIEQALCQLPGILAAKVVPQTDPEFGQRPVAYLLEHSRPHSLESIRTALKDLLPSFKHPIQIYPFTDEMLKGMKVVAPKQQLTQ